jgi:hypothetical protein
MAAKEIEAAMLSYNVELQPGARDRVPGGARSEPASSRQQLLARMMCYAGQARLPQRRMPRVDLQSTILRAAACHGHLASLDLEFRGGAIYR